MRASGTPSGLRAARTPKELPKAMPGTSCHLHAYRKSIGGVTAETLLGMPLGV